MACKEKNIKLIHISSNYVFDGIDSKPNPLNFYGITKLESERTIQEELFNYAIIRPTVLYGYNNGKNKQTFVDYVKESLKTKKTLNLNNTNQKYPLLIENIVDMIKVLIQQDLKGIFNISGKDKVTYLEWAKRIAKQQGYVTGKEKEISDESKVMRPLDVNFTIEDFSQKLIDITSLDKGLDVVDKQEKCFFKLIYKERPNKSILNQSVSEFRIKSGVALAKKAPVKSDIVIPIPESGIFSALGYAKESGIPLMFGLIRDYKTKRTLFDTDYKTRAHSLNKKLIVIDDIVKDKNIVLIDEAVVSGNTLQTVIRKLKKAGVGEIHVRIPSPPMINKCPAYMLPENIELLTEWISSSCLEYYFKANSFEYLNIEDLSNIINPKNWCLHCFGGE